MDSKDGKFIGEAWLRGNEIIVGTPVGYELDESHNCDLMGCGAWHVLYRFPVPAATSVGSTSEQYREQGWENLVVSGRIDPTKNWGIAVADEPRKPK